MKLNTQHDKNVFNKSDFESDTKFIWKMIMRLSFNLHSAND